MKRNFLFLSLIALFVMMFSSYSPQHPNKNRQLVELSTPYYSTKMFRDFGYGSYSKKVGLDTIFSYEKHKMVSNIHLNELDGVKKEDKLPFSMQINVFSVKNKANYGLTMSNLDSLKQFVFTKQNTQFETMSKMLIGGNDTMTLEEKCMVEDPAGQKSLLYVKSYLFYKGEFLVSIIINSKENLKREYDKEFGEIISSFKINKKF